MHAQYKKSKNQKNGLDMARSILSHTPLVGKIEYSLEFLEFLHSIKVEKDNPFWIIAEEYYTEQFKEMLDTGKNYEPYAKRYYKLFRTHEKHFKTVKREKENFPGEFREPGREHKYRSGHFNNKKKWRK